MSDGEIWKSTLQEQPDICIGGTEMHYFTVSIWKLLFKLDINKTVLPSPKVNLYQMNINVNGSDKLDENFTFFFQLDRKVIL